MKRIREPIPENLKVKLSTEQEWKDVLQILEDDDYLWVNGCKPTAWRSKKYNIVHLKNKLIYTTNDEKDTISAQSFIGTYSEKILYEVGDVVVVEKIGEDWDNKSSIGKTAKITEIGSCGSILLDNNKYRINYRSEWLRPATEEEIKVYQQSQKPVEDKIKVGDHIIGKDAYVPDVVCKVYEIEGNYYKYTYPSGREDKCQLRYIRKATQEEVDKHYPPKPVDNRTKLSFKTEDGYDLYDGDHVHWIMDTKVPPKPWVYQQLNGVGEWSLQYIERDNRIFHSKENAEKYIEEQNRPKEPVYTVGDWVCLKPDMMYGVITKELKSNTPYKVAKESITGTCIELEGYSETLSKDRFRPATPEEIAKATGISTVKESISVERRWKVGDKFKTIKTRGDIQSIYTIENSSNGDYRITWDDEHRDGYTAKEIDNYLALGTWILCEPEPWTLSVPVKETPVGNNIWNDINVTTITDQQPVIVVGDTVEVKVYCNIIDGEIGTVITVDDRETTMPYEVKIPNKGTFWLTKEEVKKVTTNQKSQTKIKENDKDNQTNSNNSNQQSISKQQNNDQKSISYVRRNPTIIEGSGDHSGKAIATVCKVKPTISKK